MFKLYVAAYIVYKSLTAQPDYANFSESQMIRAEDFRELIVEPTLKALAEAEPRINSDSAVELMMGTAAQETDLGFYLKQHPRGPGLGIYSIEPATHKDVLRYLDRPDKNRLKAAVMKINDTRDDLALVGDLYYATAIARVRYWYEASPLPDGLVGQAQYWDIHFNANNINQIDEYLDSYRQFVEN